MNIKLDLIPQITFLLNDQYLPSTDNYIISNKIFVASHNIYFMNINNEYFKYYIIYPNVRRRTESKEPFQRNRRRN
jgi:hypothetical protein